MVGAGLMEKIMSKSNDSSKLGHAKIEGRALEDSELAAVTGGRITTQHPAKVTVPDIKLGIS
jgi:hypothetical protein